MIKIPRLERNALSVQSYELSRGAALRMRRSEQNRLANLPIGYTRAQFGDDARSVATWNFRQRDAIEVLEGTAAELAISPSYCRRMHADQYLGWTRSRCLYFRNVQNLRS